VRHPVLARLCALLTCVLLPLALVGAWAKAVALDTDRYVETVGPLAEDPVVQAAVADRLGAAATRALDLEARAPQLAERLPPALRPYLDSAAERGSALLTEDVREAAARMVEDYTAQVLAGPEFAQAWSQANRSAHEELLAVLSEDPDQAGDDRRVSLELGTALGTLFGLLVDRGLMDASDVPDVEVSFELVRTGDLERAQEAYRWLDALGLWLPVVWALLLCATLLLGRSRLTLVWLGAGSLVTLGLLALTLVVGRDLALDRVPDRDDEVAGVVWDAVVSSLWDLLALAAGAAAVVLVLAWLSGVVSRRRTRAA
jgi:hypothetical protein